MSNLIDRQAAIKAICEHGTDLERIGITYIAVASHKQVTVDLLEQLPSTQSEIIRCKDCKYWERKSICDGYCDEMSIFGCDEDFYCGYAERKTDG